MVFDLATRGGIGFDHVVKRERALGAIQVGKVILYKGIDRWKCPSILMIPGLVDVGELIG